MDRPEARGMLAKASKGAAISAAVILLPAAGHPAMLSAAQLWLMVGVGILAHVFQPAYQPFQRNTPAEDRGTAL